jgi:hypothetical protein
VDLPQRLKPASFFRAIGPDESAPLPRKDALAESAASGTTTSEYVFFGGKRVARIDVGTPETAHYYIPDHLGSATVIASEAGVTESEEMYYPFGGERWSSGTDPNHYKFTGKERDVETGLD